MKNRPKIATWLNQQGVKYKIFKFDKEVYTVEESAKQTNLDFNQIIKSMLLVDDENNFIMVCLPGSKKIDAGKVKQIVGFKSRPHFASPVEVESKLDLQVGAVTALYAIDKMPIIFDNSIKQTTECSLSAGEHLYEIILKTQDLINLIQPQFADVAK